MGIVEKHGEIQPICNDCGVALCWSVSKDEYKEFKEFWDAWKCRDCNPNYQNSYEIFKKSKEIELITQENNKTNADNPI